MSVCLFPKCKDNAKTRGLCGLHYQYAYRLVQRKHTTWEDLEEQGKCTHKHATPRSKVNAWFLEKTIEDIKE